MDFSVNQLKYKSACKINIHMLTAEDIRFTLKHSALEN